MKLIVHPAARSLWPWLLLTSNQLTLTLNRVKATMGSSMAVGHMLSLLPHKKKGKGRLLEITLHVGLPHTAPHTNTNFRLTFLLTQLQEALYNHFPGLCFIAEVNFWCLPKTVVSCDSFIIIVIIIFFRQVFSESTEAITTSFIPLVTNFSEICAFIVGFSWNMWTTMTSLRAR